MEMGKSYKEHGGQQRSGSKVHELSNIQKEL